MASIKPIKNCPNKAQPNPMLTQLNPMLTQHNSSFSKLVHDLPSFHPLAAVLPSEPKIAHPEGPFRC